MRYTKIKVYYKHMREHKYHESTKEEYDKAIKWFGSKIGKVEVIWNDYEGLYYFPLMPFSQFLTQNL